MKRAVLFSGGVESTTLAYMHRKDRPTLLLIDFGQTALPTQRRLLHHHGKALKLPTAILRVRIPSEVCDEGLFKKGFTPKHDRYRREHSAYRGYWVEGRNYYFLAAAIGYCSAHRISQLLTGYQIEEHRWAEVDSQRQSDTGPQFVAAANVMAGCGFKNRVHVVAPFLDLGWGKPTIVAHARAIGVPLEKTDSCHFARACGKCFGCIDRAQAIKLSASKSRFAATQGVATA